MKILVVINDYLNKSNGMCISTQRFVKEFRANGHDVRIMTNNRYGALDYELNVVRIPFFANIIEKEGYTFAKVEKRTIREGVRWSDLVLLEDPFLVCRRAAIEAKKQNKTVIGSFHLYPENMSYAFKSMRKGKLANALFMRFFLWSVYKRCDIIHCPTSEVRDRLADYHMNGRLEVISNGIDERFLSRARKESDTDFFEVISVGRYAVEKNQSTLLKAVSLSRYKEQIHLSLIGQGPLQVRLESEAKALGLHVAFGFLEQKELRKKMLTSDLYIHCADVEVEGMSCMEAFACGCVPVISNARLSSTKSFALHESNLYRSQDAWDLARKIDFYYEHRELLLEHSAEYMQYAKSLSVAESASGMLELMEEALERGVSA